MKTFNLNTLTPNPSNPRVLRDDQYTKLLASIKRDPEFLSKRPIVHADNVILGGNMRYRALLEATKDPEFRAAIGTTKEGEVPAAWVLDASEFSEEQRRRFVIVDNAPDGMSGEWDWDALANEWGDIDLGDLGMDVPEVEEEILLTDDGPKKVGNVSVRIDFPQRVYLVAQNEIQERVDSIASEYGGEAFY